jgi:two-component system CheB/CheR fusion protein
MNRFISTQPEPQCAVPRSTRPMSVDRSQLDTAAPHPRLRVLVVDDQKDIALTCAEFLSLEGYAVATAFDGPSALELALREPPDVALLDIGLPGFDGYELGSRLRQHFGPRIRLIALTAFSLDEHRARTRAAGFDHHLVKPADLEQLQAILGPPV